ncbi:MAG: AraC family transcriptional regulator [Holophagaceae bacterium]|nr:AraC family transcriptional regulator [Holophagaceae bacterium]
MPGDVLQPLFEHLRIQARTFFSGNLCTVAGFDQPKGQGDLHLVRRGKGEVRYQGGRPSLQILGPCLLFYPRGLPHYLVPDEREGLDVVCTSITFGSGVGHQLAGALPDVMRLGVEEVEPLVGLLFHEAFGTSEGRQAIVDRLSEVVFIHFLRHALAQHQAEPGLIAGLVHPQLQNAITAMHAEPARDWTLDDMAASAHLSRSGFSKLFKEIVGATPGEHLARFRVSITQELLARGIPLKVAAFEVGYGSSTALSRAFRELTGASPREWLKTHRDTSIPGHSKGHGNLAP